MNRSLEELPVSRDVVLYSFPKCGRTWVRYMYTYLFGEHLAATHLTKIVDRSRHIILIRRFEDVLVSYYFEILYREGFGEIDIDGAMARTWSEASRAGMLATLGALERLPIGKRWHNRITSARKDRSLMLLFRICVDVFFEHYRYWLEQDGQKLVLRYEDLRADPIGNLRRLVDFVGRVPSVDLAQAVDRASFERMRKLELSGEGIRGVLRDGFWLPNLTTLNKDILRRSRHAKERSAGTSPTSRNGTSARLWGTSRSIMPRSPPPTGTRMLFYTSYRPSPFFSCCNRAALPND